MRPESPRLCRSFECATLGARVRSSASVALFSRQSSDAARDGKLRTSDLFRPGFAAPLRNAADYSRIAPAVVARRPERVTAYESRLRAVSERRQLNRSGCGALRVARQTRRHEAGIVFVFFVPSCCAKPDRESEAVQFRGALTSISPSRSRASRHGWSCVEGPFKTRPSARANSEPCHGQTTEPSFNVPSDNGPPRCAQL